MINIVWSQFELNMSAKDISFESFCFQVAYLNYKDYGIFESYYNTPGSEFYLILQKDCEKLNLKAGDEIGWQVKWWFNSEDNSSLNLTHKKNLLDNFSKTLKSHPSIKKWIICTPGSFIEKEFKALKTKLKKQSQQTDYTHWNKATFTNFLTEKYDDLNPVFNHYFNSNFIGFNFLERHTQRKIDNLRKKYDVDLYTPSHYDEEILLLIDNKKIFDTLESGVKYLQDDIQRIEKDELYSKADFKSFTEEYLTKAYELLYLCVNTAKEANEIISSKMSLEKGILLGILFEDHLKKYRALAEFLNKKIKTKEYLIDSQHEDLYEERSHSDYIIGSINIIENQLVSDKENGKGNISFLELNEKIFQKDLHILSSAGYGKTNIACNISNNCLQNKIPCLLLLGSDFRKPELPQILILQHLGIDSKYSFKEFLQALNTLGLIKGVKIPIIIDGLNESNPYDSIWRSNINDIIRDIDELDYVILITTCRDRYIESIFDEKDVSKIRNTKTLVGFNDSVRDIAIKKYFQKFNIVPSSWNFNKELFKNPLLLRMFSEVNRDKNGIHISLENVFNSIENYIDLIIEKSSLVKSKVDPVLKSNLKSKIETFCRTLWQENKREISLYEFHRIINPESPSLIGSLTEKLLDEGLCFQRNLEGKNETVQFTYDLVAGYCISSNFLTTSITSNKDVRTKLNTLGIADKLFNRDKEHPLRQDILMSLLHIIPLKSGSNLFEFYDNEIVIEECFNSVDYFINNEEGQKKLLDCVSKIRKDTRNFRLLFEKLFENTFKKEVHGLGSFTISLLSNLNQAEIDIYWTELIRKNRNDVYNLLLQINRDFFRNKIDNHVIEQDLIISFLTSTSSDKSLRSLSTENLFLITIKAPEKILELADKILLFKDINAIESVYIAICGAVLTLKSEIYSKNILEFIESKFLPNFTSTHICIIDYIQTIVEFVSENFNIDFTSRIIFNKNYFNVSMDKEVLKALSDGHSIHFPHLLGLDLYDFNKFQIASIASDRYYNRKTYTSIECLAIISSHIIIKGYDESFFESITKEFQEDKRYKYGRDSHNNLITYPEKYLWQSYYELVGYLVISGKLKSEDNKRYRCHYNFFDPTFPRLRHRYQIITECFLPSKNDNVQKWINDKNQDFIDKYIIQDLNTEQKWVLLSADITQAGNENDTRFNLSLDSLLLPKERVKDFKREVDKRNYHENSNSYHNIYAGEINWSNFVQKTEPGYYEEYLGLINILYDYSWTSWTSNRYQNPFFKFLNPKLSNLLGLTFQVQDLSFYDKTGNQVTKIIWTENSILFYLTKEVLERLLELLNLECTWYQFISKYGEFGMHQDHKLKPSYKDLRKVFTYSSIISN